MNKKYKIMAIVSSIVIVGSLIWLGFIIYNYFNPHYEKIINIDDNKIGYNYLKVNNNYKFLVPSIMRKMTDEEIKDKYIESDRPGLAYTDEKRAIDLLIVTKEGNVDEGDINDFVNSYYGILINTETIEAKMIKVEDKKIGYVETYTLTDNQDYYNNMRIFLDDKGYTIISVNCKREDKDKYQEYIKTILESLSFAI